VQSTVNSSCAASHRKLVRKTSMNRRI
jgi:hypothetical protein